MKTLAISNNIEVILPKMGIMTHLVELTRQLQTVTKTY